MSLFANLTRSHRGPSPRYLAFRRERGRRTLNAFAQALSETGKIGESARIAGISQQRGSQLFKQICAELGWQAQ